LALEEKKDIDLMMQIQYNELSLQDKAKEASQIEVEYGFEDGE
jgi:hypothetical protein